MAALYRAVMAVSGALALCAAQAQPSTPPEGAQDVPPAQTPKPEPSRPQRSNWEGALGLLLEYRPAFSGSSDMKLRPNLAGFVRWERITITGAGGFTTRLQDDVERGIDAEIVRRGNLKMNLSLRFDVGRDESTSGQLAGLGDVKSTVRARLGARWNFAPQWQLSVAASGDMLGKNGGMTTTVGLSHTLPIDARQRIILGGGITAGNARYMQTWYGITSEQSASSVYPVYQPGTGLRDVGVTATWRIDFDRDWAGFADVAQSYLLGPAADSPLAFRRSGTIVSAGLVRRF